MALIAVVGAGLTIFISSRYKNLFNASASDSELSTADSSIRNIQTDNKLFDSVNALLVPAPELAGKLLDSAIGANPGRGIYYTYRGIVYASLKNDSLALEKYQKAMDLGGRYPLVLYHRGQSLIRTGQFEMGIANMKEAAEKNVDYELMIAKMYEQNKNRDSAIVYLKKYVDHHPQATAERIYLDSLVAGKK